MSEVVLDATALLALLLDESGGKQVEEHLADAKVSAVSLAEVAARLTEQGMPIDEIRDVLEALGVEVVPFDTEMAYMSASLRVPAHKRRISLGARASLALGKGRDAAVLTADQGWAKLDIDVRIDVIGQPPRL